MKDKVKILIGAGIIIGQMLAPIGMVSAAGADINSMPVPNDEHGPELYIKRIDPDNQKVYVYYEDRGAMQGTLTNLNIFWPRKVEDLRAERVYDEDFEFDFDEMAMDVGRANQWWTGVQYNSNTVRLLDAQAVPVAALWPDVYKLADNPYSVLYISAEITEGGVRSYWVGKADYSDCMKYYQPGVVCEGQLKDDLTIKYAPYLNGILIEPEEELEDNAQPEDDRGNDDAETDNNTNDVTNESQKEDQLTKPAVATETLSKVLLAGVGSSVIDSGSNGTTSTKSVVNTLTNDESAESNQDADIHGDEVEAEATNDGAYEDDATDNNTVAVPDLGGNEEQNNFWPLVLGAFGVAAAALMMYWWIILPLVKRKKDDEETQE